MLNHHGEAPRPAFSLWDEDRESLMGGQNFVDKRLASYVLAGFYKFIELQSLYTIDVSTR